MLLHTNYHLKSNLKQMHVELEPWIGRNCNKIKNDKRRIDHISVRAKLPILTPICAKFTEFILKHFYWLKTQKSLYFVPIISVHVHLYYQVILVYWKIVNGVWHHSH